MSKFVSLCESKFLGGFGKTPGAPPDILHSFYSVCWQSLVASNRQDGTAEAALALDYALVIRRDRADLHASRSRRLEGP